MQFFLSLFFKQYWHIECSGFGQLGQLPFRWNRKQLLAREWIIGIQPIYAVIVAADNGRAFSARLCLFVGLESVPRVPGIAHLQRLLFEHRSP
ncbi:uncharacterized protein LOC143143720 isoform X6 [Ptiloglossa arizonensis]|uniref:uncharacterized protein LOC143143720 isoform X6 n=1 Tax=Ptiloglossa arizonensis TaxID=3350558 RepID=UPI003FA06AAD